MMKFPDYFGLKKNGGVSGKFDIGVILCLLYDDLVKVVKITFNAVLLGRHLFLPTSGIYTHAHNVYLRPHNKSILSNVENLGM